MGADTPQISIGAARDSLYVNVETRATQRICPTVDRIVHDYLAVHGDGSRIVIDVAGCDWVDSTFAGWLVGLQKRLEKARGALQLTGCSERCRASLGKMNLDRLLSITTVAAPDQTQTLPCVTSDHPTPAEIKLMLEAHEQLAAINDENRQVFQPIVELLKRQAGS